MTVVEAEIAGERVLLDARRALYWPRAECLMIADVHLGRSSLLRQAGAALPIGTTTSDLARLDDVIAAHTPRQLIVLGDLIHGRERRDAPWLATFAAWRKRNAQLKMTLIAGNHDRHMTLRDMGFDIVSEVDAQPFRLLHEHRVVPARHVIAGHVHPGVRVREGRMSHRFPAFWIGEQRSLLPAFSRLSGLALVAAERTDSIYAITPGGLLPMGSTLARR